GFRPATAGSGRDTDCLLEGDGFELPVPLAMQGRPTPIIAGYGCMQPSLHFCSCRRWISAKPGQSEISEPKPYRGTGSSNPFSLQGRVWELSVPLCGNRRERGYRCRTPPACP